MDLEGRIAVVTGGAVRVGGAITRELAFRGASVFIHYNRSAGPAEALREEIVAVGGVAAIGSVDLSNPEAAPDLIAAAGGALGPPTILVNSASGFPSDTIDDVTVAGFRSAQDLSLTTPMMLIQAFARHVPDDLGGAVVNVTDVKTMRPYRKHLSYMLAKGGIDTLTRAAAVALAPKIRVNAVALGVILPPAKEDDAYAENLAADLPLQRIGGAQVVADTVAFLCENDFITGEIIRVDGGGHLV
ncbi:MAG: SDR family oxidoreductase [Acidimicrobiia bacterium]|nr:MAG: SDR family oxidoreductase [Acidimicrobiia bacterium]